MYESLKGEVARIKQIRKLTYEDLAEITGYKPNTIAQFMSGTRETEAVASALARGLDIQATEVWRPDAETTTV